MGAGRRKGSENLGYKPVFTGDNVHSIDWLKLLFYPKKFFLYKYIKRSLKYKNKKTDLKEPIRILDVGCGTGAAVIDLKKIFGRRAEIIGIDVVKIQIELAKERAKKYGVHAEFKYFNGENFPFPAEYFDAVYTSDVLGHVKNVPAWLEEIQRVLKTGAPLAMFSESKLGKHAYIRNYLFEKGLNIDPHAEFHISLYSKKKLKALITKAGFDIEKMYNAFWSHFLVHPDEFFPKLKNNKNFPFLSLLNLVLYFIKKITHPVSTALAELYGLVEMKLIGRWIEAQGYVILARKHENTKTREH